MSEVTFAKSFLATLDKRPIKLPADHVSDARKYPNQSPSILPKQTHPFPRRDRSAASQQAKEKAITATLKPMRSGEAVTLKDLTLNSIVHEIKIQYAQATGNPSQPLDKIKLLLNKKPATDLKTLKDLGVQGDTVEFTVMLMGGGTGGSNATTPAVEKTEAATMPAVVPAAVPASDPMDVDSNTAAPDSEQAQAEAVEKESAESGSANATLQTEEFWSDLGGFLEQRLRSESEGKRVAGVFREAWRSKQRYEKMV